MEKILDKTNIRIIKEDKFKFVTIRVSFLADLEYKYIAAYNLLVRLLTTRNEKYPSFDLFNAYLENAYGMSMKGGYFNRGNVGIFNIISTCMNARYSLNEDLLLEQITMIKDCLFNPHISEEALNEIKRIYIEKLKEQNNKKTYVLKKKINEKLGNDNPYGINIESDIKSVEKVTLDEIKEVYNKIITSQCYIYVCGDIDEERTISLLNDDRFNFKGDNLLDLSYLKNFDNQEILEVESHFLQSAISLMYQCEIKYNDALYYPLKVFLEMFNYDLFNIIREKYNYCYYIYAISNNYLNTVEIVSEIDSKNLNDIINIIENILKEYQINFNLEQFKVSKNKILTYIKNSTDSATDLIDINFGFDFNKNVTSLEELKASYIAVSDEDIKKVASMLSLKLVSILKEGKNNG